MGILDCASKIWLHIVKKLPAPKCLLGCLINLYTELEVLLIYDTYRK